MAKRGVIFKKKEFCEFVWCHLTKKRFNVIWETDIWSKSIWPTEQWLSRFNLDDQTSIPRPNLI